MAFIKNTSYTDKLRKRFVENNKNRWAEYELIGEYSNNKTKTLFRHNCGNEFMMTPHNFSAGHGCPKCGRNITANKLKKIKGSKFLDIIRNNDEYELLDDYVDSKTAVRVLHTKCGRVFSRIPSTVNSKTFNGELCSLCAKEKSSKKITYTLEQANVRLSQVNDEYEFVEYNGASKSAIIKHKVCGKEFEHKAAYFIIGDGHCPYCTTNISKEERHIFEWFKTICPDAVQGDRSILGGRELDMYSPSKKVAIEYNGTYWHSIQSLTKDDKMTVAEAKKYHRRKSDICASKGVRLIHIWDYVWADERKRSVLKNIVLGATQSLPERYFARKCEIHRYTNKDVKWGELNAFFAQNNIQGNRGGSLVYTLEQDGRILMAYKFGRPSGGRAKKKYQYEMVRGASAPGVQVVGGATKLWKHFINNEKPESVVYYIDYNYFDGRSVEKIGLKHIGGQPGVKNYFIKDKEVKNRQPRKHAEIKQQIKRGEVLELYNSGTKTYEYRVDKP